MASRWISNNDETVSHSSKSDLVDSQEIQYVDEFLQGNFHHAVATKLSQQQVLDILSQKPEINDEITSNIIGGISVRKYRANIQNHSPVYDQMIAEKLYKMSLEEVIEMSSNIDGVMHLDAFEQQLSLYTGVLRNLTTSYISSLSKEDFFAFLTKILQRYGKNIYVRKFIKEILLKGLPWRTSETYAYMYLKNPSILEDESFLRYMSTLYNPSQSLIGASGVSGKEVEQYFLHHMDILSVAQKAEILKTRLYHYADNSIDDKKIVLQEIAGKDFTIEQDILGRMLETDWKQRQDALASLDTSSQQNIYLVLLKVAIQGFQDARLDKLIEKNICPILLTLESELLKILYDSLIDTEKNFMICLLKGKVNMTFVDQRERDQAGLQCFLASEQSSYYFKKYITKEFLKNCSVDEIKKIITNPNVLHSQEYQDTIANYTRDMEDKIIKRIPKVEKLQLIKDNYAFMPFLCRLFNNEIHHEDRLDLYHTMPEDTNKDIKNKIFDCIRFGEKNGIQFAIEYPVKGFVDEDRVRRDSNQHYDVYYTHEYQNLLKDPHTEDAINAIKAEIFDKLKGGVLVDLGCGAHPFNTMALAVKSNAAAFVGIDVNVSGELCGTYQSDESKKWIMDFFENRMDIKDIQANDTILKNVFDNFENFLERVPTRAGYNFTINGLILTNSTNAIKKHINRIMKPGNIIIANTLENIDIASLMEGPYRLTIFGKEYADSICVYEKLAVKKVDLKSV